MPAKKQDILKIRYWRTGRHLPVNHRQCVAFGRALGLDGEEMRYLLQGYYDGCDEVHEEESTDMQSVYWKRRKAMQRLVDGYLRGISGTGPLSHTFTVSKTGFHRVYVENLGSSTISVLVGVSR